MGNICLHKLVLVQEKGEGGRAQTSGPSGEKCEAKSQQEGLFSPMGITSQAAGAWVTTLPHPNTL